MKRQIILFIFSMVIVANLATAQENNNVFSYSVGEYRVYLLSEGQQKGNTGILIGATSEMIAEYIPDGTFPNASNAFLVQTPDNKNWLFDTGYGRLLFSNLQYLGLTADDIDAILITHMHGDHIGGLLKNDIRLFSHAKLYIPQEEYNYWTSDEAMNRLPENNRGGFEFARKVIKAYEKQLILFNPNELGKITETLLPGIKPIAAYGHTPGHTTYLIESGKDKVLLWGDLTHAMAIQIPYPQVAVTYDVNPAEAVKTRLAILDYVSKNNIPIAGMHIAFPATGTIKAKAANHYTYTAQSDSASCDHLIE
ncbi:MAG: MBL fold metallo-hydrolase [Dysgonamonadaceae bacterium]|jgi:glyoxylase-like metal-dependent hydrolase (beta-lactamase superfamily II)|nr:MBL fold metallo-hydrolase [Dysgonamonadaceae bacterium]